MMKNKMKKLQIQIGKHHEENILTGKDKHIIKAVDEPTIKLVQRLKSKSRKIMCNYKVNQEISRNTQKKLKRMTKT